MRDAPAIHRPRDSPPTPTATGRTSLFTTATAQSGRRPEFSGGGPEGRRFKSCLPDLESSCNPHILGSYTLTFRNGGVQNGVQMLFGTPDVRVHAPRLTTSSRNAQAAQTRLEAATPNA